MIYFSMIRMMDTEQNLLQKKSDLKLYYDMAHEAAQENNVDEARKISLNGLRIAQSQERSDWVDKFNSFNSQLSQRKSNTTLIPSIVKEDLTVLKGIGPFVAERLTNAGIRSINLLAKTTATKLALIPGIGLSTAQKMIDKAKDHLHTKTLNGFSQSKERSNKENQLKVKDERNIELDDSEYNKRIEQNVTFEEISEEDVTLETVKSNFKTPGEPWFEEKFNYSRLTDDLNTAKIEIVKNEELNEYEEPLIVEQNEVNSEDFDDLDEESEEDSNYSSHVIPPSEFISEIAPNEPTNNEEQKETLTSYEMNILREKIGKQLKLCEFLIVDKSTDLQAVFTGIDLLALKRIRVNEFLDILYFLPIKVSNLKGKFVVSADKIDYTPNKEIEGNFHLNKIPRSYIKALQKAETTIFNDMSTRGELFRYLVKHFQFDISIEKTLMHKSLFFRSGPVQYKLLIEPLIISSNSVGFTEKLIPFAYHKNSNIHIIEMAQLRKILHFLDQKCFLIETYHSRKSAISINCEVEERFMKNLRKFSSPFILYGFALLIIFLFQKFSILIILINVGYGVVGLYIVIIGYIYLRFFKEKRQIKQEFATPFYQKKIELDDTDLTLIREELTPKLMEQFTYEVMGNNNNSSVIAEIEQTNARYFLESKKMKNLVDNTDFFEEEGGSPRRSENSKVKSTLIEKYSSFLED